MRHCLLLLLLCAAAAPPAAGAPDAAAEAELRALAGRVPRFRVVDIPARAGEVVLRPEQGLTVENLRGVPLDNDPPVLGKPAKAYDPRMTDAHPEGEAPYVARGIRPFRFRFFHNEFNYGGWHNLAMSDYAAAHGFDILSAYARKPADATHLPAGTQWLSWGGFVDWHKWLPQQGIAEGRYDILASVDVAGKLAEAGTFKHDPAFSHLMIDMEHGRLSLEGLRAQPWYPSQAGEVEKRAFEKRYYEGYALTYAGPVDAARRAGWTNVSVYGWEPFGRTFWGVEKARVDPETDWAWNAYGRRIYEAVDILNPSVYCFYWSPQNVAYVLANIDLNLKLVNSMPRRKPVRPYYWTLLHGGGGGWRWWANQPQPDEDVRAQVALGFFTGFDGLDTWNWSGTGSHHAPPPLKPDADVMLKEGFQRAPAGGGEPAAFRRYDVLHVLSVDDAGLVRFQLVRKEKAGERYGIAEGQPVYAMPREELSPRLRPASEAVAATVEGLALVKPFEYLLRHGEVKSDVSAQEQFARTLPIVRRVKLGALHVLATYDPMVLHGGEPREVVLGDFDGHRGITVRLPADGQVRLFVLRAAG